MAETKAKAKSDDAEVEVEAEASARKPEGRKWEPTLENEPVGVVETARTSAAAALKTHEDALRTARALRREPEPPRCEISKLDDKWGWSYADQRAVGFETKSEAVAHAKENVVPLLDGNGAQLGVIFEVKS